MRVVMIPAALLLCAAPIFAQGTQANLQPDNPANMMSRRQMGNQPALPAVDPSIIPVDVPPDTPIATLNGVCDQKHETATKQCKTVITRAQIDAIADLLIPGATPIARRTFALNYVRLLAASAAAENEHLENEPAVAAELNAQLKQTRMRVLANSFYHHIEANAAEVPEPEIQKYYTEHQAQFDAGMVRRLSIPRAALTKTTRPADGEAVRANLEELVARASKGEDFDQIQQEAYLMFGIATPPPPTKATMMRRTSLRPDEAKVFDLNVGEVTPILNTPDAFEMLKLESKQPVPIEAAAPEITPILARERKSQELQNAAKTVTAELDLVYLGLSSAPDLFSPSGATDITASRGPVPAMRSRGSVHRRMPAGVPADRAFPPVR